MLTWVFVAGFVIFSLSSAYFYFTNQNKGGLRSAFLVSFLTVVSYAVMWQGELTATSASGQAVYWTRWLFYALSCTLLIIEIAQVKGIGGGQRAHLVYMTATVMLTGVLAAVGTGWFKWIFFIVSSVAYLLVVLPVLGIRTAGSTWVTPYILFGWTVFPVVFFLAPAGLGLIGAGLANLLYLLLDLYTKIVFNVQLARKS